MLNSATAARNEGEEKESGAGPDVADTCQFRGGLVFKAHRLLYLSTLGVGPTSPKPAVPI